MAKRIQIARGTRPQWLAANPVLPDGVPAYETDTGELRVGDGVTAYDGLPTRTYAPGPGGIPEGDLTPDVAARLGAVGLTVDRFLPAAVVDGSAPLTDTFAAEADVEAAFPALADPAVRRALQTRGEREDFVQFAQALDVRTITADHASILEAAAVAYAADPKRPARVVIDRPMTINRGLAFPGSIWLECVGEGRLIFTPDAFPTNTAVRVMPRFVDMAAVDTTFGDEHKMGFSPDAIFVDEAQGHAAPGWRTDTLTLPVPLPAEVAPGRALYLRLGTNQRDGGEPYAEGVWPIAGAVDNGDGTSTITLGRSLPPSPPTTTLTAQAVSAPDGDGVVTVTLAEPLGMQLKEDDENDFGADGGVPQWRTVLRWSSGAVSRVHALAEYGDETVRVTLDEGAIEAGDTAEWGVEHVVMLVEEEPYARLDLEIEVTDGGPQISGLIDLSYCRFDLHVRADRAPAS